MRFDVDAQFPTDSQSKTLEILFFQNHFVFIPFPQNYAFSGQRWCRYMDRHMIVELERVHEHSDMEDTGIVVRQIDGLRDFQ